MDIRILVERAFPLLGRGTVISGPITEGDVCTGDVLVVEGTTDRVRVLGLEMHVRQPETGRRVGLVTSPEDALAVTAGSVLVSARPARVQG